MERWHLPSVEASGKRNPRVLFSRAEARGVLIDLQAGDELGDHRLHESALVYVVSGAITLDSDGRSVECETGTLLTFSSGETRSLAARSDARILLLLTPWPGEGHFSGGERVDPARMPAQAAEPPLSA
jgi:quercetin dioxygenase-like cupin family protein